MVEIKQKRIGDNNECYITFEAGPTHDGLEMAKRLVKHAVDAGADAVKFQILDADQLVADREMLFSYEILVDRETGKTKTVSEPLYNILKRRMLTRGEWRSLKEYSDELDVAFFATVTSFEEVDFAEEIGCHSIKVASGDVNHIPLLKRVARTGMCIQLDTGSSTIGEVEQAVDAILREGNDQIIIHQCPSGYPARLESINLNIIPTLKRMFGLPVAFSDHTPGAEMDIAAVAIGANLLEKTITEDRMTPSVEHIMSLEPHEMKGFVDTIRKVEVALGASRRLMGEKELANRSIARRSIHVKHDLPMGHIIEESDLDYRRPAGGIAPSDYKQVLNRQLITSIAAGKRILLENLK